MSVPVDVLPRAKMLIIYKDLSTKILPLESITWLSELGIH